jgi:hypothetical protein
LVILAIDREMIGERAEFLISLCPNYRVCKKIRQKKALLRGPV